VSYWHRLPPELLVSSSLTWIRSYHLRKTLSYKWGPLKPKDRVKINWWLSSENTIQRQAVWKKSAHERGQVYWVIYANPSKSNQSQEIEERVHKHGYLILKPFETPLTKGKLIFLAKAFYLSETEMLFLLYQTYPFY
jgi:hypothetical protein